MQLAKQIASIGGDPQTALKSGTFAPGKIGDPTAKGNSCDTANDPIGCIFTQNLLVEDATAAEIDAAVSGTTVAAPASTTVASTPPPACPVATTPAAVVATSATGGEFLHLF